MQVPLVASLSLHVAVLSTYSWAAGTARLAIVAAMFPNLPGRSDGVG